MIQGDSSRLDGPTRRRHWEMLVVAVLVLVGSFALQMRSREQVGLIFTTDWVLPPLCLAREWFGVSCPGCGLTRSFIHLARGDFQASWDCHRIGWLLAVFVVLQIPYRIHGLCRRDQVLLPAKIRKWIANCLIGLLIGNWLIGLLW